MHMQSINRKIKEKDTLFKWIFLFAAGLSILIWACLLFGDPEGLQKNVFFQDAKDWFMDFFNTVYYSVGKSPYTWGNPANRNYLPIAYLIVYPFTALYAYAMGNDQSPYLARYTQLNEIAVLLFTGISMLLLLYLLYRACKGSESLRVFTVAVLALCGVSLFSYDRANQIILSTALACAFLMTYRSKKRALNHLGFLCLALSASLKLFPAFLGILLLYDKRYKDALITVFYGLLFAFVPFLWLQGSLAENLTGYVAAVKAHALSYSGGALGLGAPSVLNTIYPSFMTGISLAITLLAVVAAGFQKSEWKRVLTISLTMALASGQQAYYCLLILYYPLVLFLN